MRLSLARRYPSIGIVLLPKRWSCFAVGWEFFDELERICTEAIEVSAGGAVCGLNIQAGQWHTIRALESGSVILEMKEGRYEAISDTDILSL